MSGTDTENEYESADDEDSLKAEGISHIAATTTKKENAVCVGKAEENTDSYEEKTVVNTVSCQEKAKENTGSCGDKINENTDSENSLKVDTKKSPAAMISDEITTIAGDVFKKNVVGNNDGKSMAIEPLNIIEEKKTEAEIKLKESDAKNVTEDIQQSSVEEKDKNVIDTQPRRVTLRLEKKLQEKNQAAASDSNSSNVIPDGDKPLEKPSSSWGFSSWGSSLLSTAASSVSTFTNQVSQGIGTVLETVESSLGAPAPEDLATLLKERRDLCENSPEKEDIISPREAYLDDDEEGVPATSSLFTGVTSLTKAIESTGGKVIMGGLDALELIGKKTIDILTEGDPGLRQKRTVFSGDMTLSQVLREAKGKAEEDQKNASFENQEEAIHFSSYFDEFQGLIHLEALEMLSSQCQSKVQGALMVGSADSPVKDRLEEVKQICEDLPSVDESTDERTQDFGVLVSEHVKALQLQIDIRKVELVRNAIHTQLDQCISEQDTGHVKDAKELYRQAISSLAEFTAKCVEQFHKFGELILVQTDPNFDVLSCATHITGLTTVLCIEVGIISNKYCQCLNTAADDSDDPDAITPLITTVYLESSNSTTYIQDAFQLLVPVLQSFSLQ